MFNFYMIVVVVILAPIIAICLVNNADNDDKQ